MLCVKCGSEVNPGEKFCTNCGTATAAPAQNSGESYAPTTAPQPAPIPAQSTGVPYAPASSPQQTYAPQQASAPVQTYAPEQVYAPAPAPTHAPKPQKEKKPKKERNRGGLKLRLLQVPVCIVLAGLMFFFIFLKGAVSIQTTGTEHFTGSNFSLFHIINSLIFGLGRYNPSVLSICMGGTTLAFIVGASAFWLISAIAALIHKGENGMRRIAGILTVLALALSCVLPLLAYRFVPQFKFIYARASSVLTENISGVFTPLIYVWAGVVALLMVVLWILAFKCNKKERLVTEDEK